MSSRAPWRSVFLIVLLLGAVGLLIQRQYPPGSGSLSSTDVTPSVCVKAVWWPIGCANVAVENLGDALVPILLRGALEKGLGEPVEVRRAGFGDQGKLVLIGSELHETAHFLRDGDVVAGMGTKRDPNVKTNATVKALASSASKKGVLLVAVRGLLSRGIACPAGTSKPCLTSPAGLPFILPSASKKFSIGDPVLALGLLRPDLASPESKRTCLGLAMHLHQAEPLRALERALASAGGKLPSRSRISKSDHALLEGAGMVWESLAALEKQFGCLHPVYMAFTPSTSTAEDLVRRLTARKAVVSSSLHGAVIADAYGVPSRVLLPPQGTETEVKFRDYYSGIGHDRKFKPARTLNDVIKDGFEQLDMDKVQKAGKGWLDAVAAASDEIVDRIGVSCEE